MKTQAKKPVRVLQIPLFTFDQLSKEAQQKAIEDHRNGIDEIYWADENRQTMEKFAEIFPIRVKDWSYGGRGEGVFFEFTTDRDEIEELTGQRLATYLWNNFRTDLFKGKYYGHLSPKDAKGRKIKVSKDFPIGQRHVLRHSRIILEHSCVLTGYCMDDIILAPIYSFLDKPTKENFRELLENCFSEWVKGCNEDADHQRSDEYIRDEIEANEYLFEEDGTKY